MSFNLRSVGIYEIEQLSKVVKAIGLFVPETYRIAVVPLPYGQFIPHPRPDRVTEVDAYADFIIGSKFGAGINHAVVGQP